MTHSLAQYTNPSITGALATVVTLTGAQFGTALARTTITSTEEAMRIGRSLGDQYGDAIPYDIAWMELEGWVAEFVSLELAVD